MIIYNIIYKINVYKLKSIYIYINISFRTINNYMHWHYTDEMVEYLSKRFRTIKKIKQKINTIEGFIDFIYLFKSIYIYRFH